MRAGAFCAHQGSHLSKMPSWMWLMSTLLLDLAVSRPSTKGWSRVWSATLCGAVINASRQDVAGSIRHHAKARI